MVHGILKSQTVAGFIFLFFGLNSFPISAQQVKIGKLYFKSYLTDTKKIITSPARWHGDQWIAAGLAVTAGSILYTQDAAIQELYQANRNNTRNTISKYFAEPLGDGKYVFSGFGIIYLNGIIFKNNRSKKVALLGIQSFILSGIAANVPKYIFQRHRPYQDSPPKSNQWDGPENGYSHFTSFPSGHSTTAFSWAAILSEEYKDHDAVPFLCYTAATLVGLSRINDNKHWASDVFAGALIGYLIGKVVSKNHPWLTNVSFVPAVSFQN